LIFMHKPMSQLDIMAIIGRSKIGGMHCPALVIGPFRARCITTLPEAAPKPGGAGLYIHAAP
jgi:hypothetical protein